MKKGGWVFISHSHQDIELVRKIRNFLESLGLEPLMFYLKCLSDENEIESLIKREIDERDWFIYADSKNARSSNWVKTERDYIETVPGKKIFTINLNENIDNQLECIRHIARQMKVFISASRRDKILVDRLREKLLERDMLVLSDDDAFAGGVDFCESVENALSDAARDGFVVILITETSASSAAVKQEIKLALESGAKIVPVFVGKATLTPELFAQLGDAVGVHIGVEPSDEELVKIVDSILQRVEYYEKDFTNGTSYRAARSIRLPAISRIDNLTFFDCDNLECVYIPDSVIYITPDAFEEHPNILVKCSRGSYAQGYCERNNIKYELVGIE